MIRRVEHRLSSMKLRHRRPLPAEGFVEMVDLLVVLLKSGRSTRQAFVCLVDALPALTDRFGATAISVVNVLAAAERDGLPLAPVLERLVHEAHAERQRRAQADAAQLPVRLAFPLVLCILPSFVALTVVPIFVGALSSLSLSRT